MFTLATSIADAYIRKGYDMCKNERTVYHAACEDEH